MLTEYEILNNCYQKSPKSIETDKKQLQKQKRLVLQEKDVCLYNHNKNEIKTYSKPIMTIRIDIEEAENRCIALGLKKQIKTATKKAPNLAGNILGRNHKSEDNLYVNNLYMLKGV